MRDIILIAHDIRSTHNVGSLLRTAEGLGVTKVYLTGYTPYPQKAGDPRLPHIALKLTQQIHKTALGAEMSQKWEQAESIDGVLNLLRSDGYILVGLEQTAESIPLASFKPPDKIVLLLGREVEGIEPNILKKLDQIVEIPMFGSKESFNVVQAAAMCLYHLRFTK
jgi:23S rRNA (guanosine2251-2'-O)-methyltransferase